MSSDQKATKNQLLKVIDELQANPNDRVRILGDLGISAVGVGLGAAAAGTVAAIAGATSIPVFTTAASWLGITVIAATPVGWTIGIAAAGGVLVYGISRFIRDGGMSEGRKRELLQVYQEQLRDIQFRERAEKVHHLYTSATARALLWQRSMSWVVKPPQPHWFFNSSKPFSQSARSR